MDVKLPIVIKAENVGANFMPEMHQLAFEQDMWTPVIILSKNLLKVG
jgi:hypothetical protein